MKRPWWRRWWVVGTAAILIVLPLAFLLAPTFARPILESKLQRLIGDPNGGKITLGRLHWSLPYHFAVDDVRFDSPALGCSASRVQLSFAEWPGGKGPALIDDLSVDSPRIVRRDVHDTRIDATTQAGAPSSGRVAASQPSPTPFRLSDHVRVRRFNVSGGVMEWPAPAGHDLIRLNNITFAAAPPLGSAAPAAMSFTLRGDLASVLSGASVAIVGDADLDALRATIELPPLAIKRDDVTIELHGGHATIDRSGNGWSASDVRFAISPPTQQQHAIQSMRGAIAGILNAVGPLDAINRPDRIVATVHCTPQNLSFQPKGVSRPIDEFEDCSIEIANGMATLHTLRAECGGDVFYIERAQLPLRDWPNRIVVPRMNGALTFGPTHSPAYSPPLDALLNLAQPHGLVFMDGSAQIDFAHSDIDAPTVDYRLHLTSDRLSISEIPHHLPLQNVKAEIILTPASAKIDRFDANVLAGQISAGGIVSLGAASTYSGTIRLRQVDLNSLAQICATEGQPPFTATGELSCDAQISGSGFEPDALDRLRTSGAMQVIHGQMFRVPVLKDIGEAIHLTNLGTVGEAACRFSVASDRTVTLSDVAVGSPIVGVRGEGTLGFDGKVSFDAVATPFNDWERQIEGNGSNDVANVAARMAGAVQSKLNDATERFLYKVHVGGTIDAPQTQLIAAPALNK